MCDFIAAHLAPACSLPPEVPGVAYIDVGPRQAWWAATIAATAIALLAAPHVIGAPQPYSFEGPVSPELAALFAVRALGAGLAAWAAHCVAVALVGRGSRPATGDQLWWRLDLCLR